MPREEQINLKMTGEELKNLKRLAKSYAISPQNVLRMLLKRESDSLLGNGRQRAQAS